MPPVVEVDTWSARLAGLPVTEHAILLNRFKFLDLVQRVAAADVSEMVQTIGLEALLCKGTLEGIPLLRTPAASEKETTTRQGGDRRRASPQRGDRKVTPNMSRNVLQLRGHRFSSREKEVQFIERMSRPQKRSDLLDHHRRQRQRGYQEEGGTYVQNKLTSMQRPKVLKATSAASSHHWESADRQRDPCTSDVDDVMMDSSFDRPSNTDVPLRIQAGAPPNGLNAQHRLQTPQPRAQEQERKDPVEFYADIPEHPIISATGSGLISRTGGAGTSRHADGANAGLNRYGNTFETPQTSAVPQHPSTDVEASLTERGPGGLRSRTPFAPKAKPKAAEVSRVPLEVIRHASALLVSKKEAPAPAPPVSAPPQQHLSPTAPVGPGGGSLDDQGAVVSFVTSQSPPQLYSLVQSSKQGDSDLQRGNISTLGTPMTLSNDALLELASSVERMLQDHQTVLDSIVKEGVRFSSDLPKGDRKAENEEDDVVDVANDVPSSKTTSCVAAKRRLRNAVSEVESARIVRQAYDALEDISDEEDELLLASRLQRQLGAMGRELAAIEQREQQHESLNIEKKEYEDKEQSSRPIELQKRRGRSLTIIEPKSTTSKSTRAVSGRRRRRGEMPRAIVERLRSFQKENIEYIRYTEKEWNTSHVTEQVFAQRLANTLLEDAFQEVLEEVGNILDTYVEGLALHELQ